MFIYLNLLLLKKSRGRFAQLNFGGFNGRAKKLQKIWAPKRPSKSKIKTAVSVLMLKTSESADVERERKMQLLTAIK